MNKSMADTDLKDEKRCINLGYIKKFTNSDPLLMEEMMQMYLDQIPPILNDMNSRLAKKDWAKLRATMHKLIPSFAIVGIDSKYENIAKMVQDCASMFDQTGQISGLVLQLDTICNQACNELEEELNIIKNEKS